MDKHEIDRTISNIARDLVPLGRRRFLRTGVAAAAAGAVLTQTGCSPAPGKPRPTGVSIMNDVELSMFERLVPVILPAGVENDLIPVSRVPVLENLDKVFEHFPTKLRNDFATGLKLFHYGSIVLGLHLKTFLSLDDEAALAYCRRWESGNDIQRGLMGAIKQLIFMSYWREPVTWGPIGYEGPFTVPNGVPRLGNQPRPAT